MAKIIISNFSVFSFAFLAALTVYDVQAQRQIVTLGNGFNHYLILDFKVPKLNQFSFDNNAVSVCGTGTWLFYDHEFYNGGVSSGDMEFYFGNNSCVNFQGMSNRTSSLRYVGASNDYRQPSLTFFQDVYFRGQEESYQTDVPYFYWLSRNVSLIVTGNEPWTIYDSSNYGGNAVCISPPVSDVPYQPAFVYDIDMIGNIPHRAFRSARRGCFANTTKYVNPETTAKRVPRMSKPFFLGK